MTTDELYQAYKDQTPVWSIPYSKWGYIVQVTAHGIGFFGTELESKGVSHNPSGLSFTN